MSTRHRGYSFHTRGTTRSTRTGCSNSRPGCEATASMSCSTAGTPTLGATSVCSWNAQADTGYRVVAICTAQHVEKADAAEGGVGYERKMITPSLMADLHGNRVVPVLRDNPDGELP